MMNKKWVLHIVTVVFLVVLESACVSTSAKGRPASLDRAIEIAARSIEDNVERGQKIALLNFSSPTEQFSEYALEELSAQLVHGRKLIVVDRRELDLIRQEEKFQLSGDVSDESAQAIGRKLGAQLIVSGSLSPVGNVYRFRIRVLNVETAAIEASPATDISAEDERVVSLLDGKGPIQVNTGSRQTTAPVVYIAGFNGDVACYWVNGVRTDLAVPGGASANVGLRGIVASGGRVYVAGELGSPNTACYWVDGVRTDLPVPGGTIGSATGIAVSGGRVYVSGWYNSRNINPTACYWVDGVRTDLPTPSGVGGWTTSTDIAVSAGKVYVAGIYSRNDNATGCYWVDGVRTDLPEATKDASRIGIMNEHSIAVSGGRVYVSGTYTRNNNTTSCYWVDGVRTDLPAPGGARGYTSYIVVSDGRVYVSGAYTRNSDMTRCYWVDGARTDIPFPPGAEGWIGDIAVSDGRVYVPGAYGRYPDTTGCYWVDGVRTDLPLRSANFIAVGR